MRFSIALAVQVEFLFLGVDIEQSEDINNEAFLDDIVEWRAGGETGLMIDFDEFGFEL